ncbi:carboxymuconolactone decarboxylase family protein [Nonomuraea sp. NPDC049152]|uniref:carboxymuconolactone decarboxylase family protein n=1 Tax=Nonomuraea sp. NPDC049152 TaxID=3154350 RepID=UPI00340E8FCF
MIKPVQGDPKLDKLPNMVRVMANSPAVLEGYQGLARALKKSTLPQTTFERIALTVGAANACSYCVAAHTYSGKTSAGLSDADVELAKQGSAEDAKEAAAVEFARALTETRGNADPSEARAAGWSDEQILEIIALVALQTMTNYVNKVAETENDWPAA